jgi:hypothetical protein
MAKRADWGLKIDDCRLGIESWGFVFEERKEKRRGVGDFYWGLMIGNCEK